MKNCERLVVTYIFISILTNNEFHQAKTTSHKLMFSDITALFKYFT